MILTAEQIFRACQMAFMAAGANESDATIVANELLDSNLMGIDTHGFLRICEYLSLIKKGTIVPGAPIEVQYETSNSVIVNGNRNFGILTATALTGLIIDKALKHNIAIGATRHCMHIGRLGAYTQKAANAGLVALGFVNSSRHGHFVSPFGGSEGRLATNPLSYSFPTKEDPIVFDASTSMVSEGKIRILRQEGKLLPDHCVLTADGRPSNDPNEFYEPVKGTILPFGGAMGYKGFGLSLFVELMGATLSGVPLTPDGEKDEYINGFTLIAINPKIFGEDNDILDEVETLKAYILSAKPAVGSKGVVMPGELDFCTKARRIKDGVEVGEETWRQIVESGKEFGIDLELAL